MAFLSLCHFFVGLSWSILYTLYTLFFFINILLFINQKLVIPCDTVGIENYLPSIFPESTNNSSISTN